MYSFVFVLATAHLELRGLSMTEVKMFERDYHSTRQYPEDRVTGASGNPDQSGIFAPARRWLGRFFGTKAASEFEALQPFDIRWLEERSLLRNQSGPRPPDLF